MCNRICDAIFLFFNFTRLYGPTWTYIINAAFIAFKFDWSKPPKKKNHICRINSDLLMVMHSGIL